MIQIEKKVNGKIETIEIAENWDEVYYSTYVQMMKNNTLSIEDDLERSVKVLSSVSSSPEKCEKWIREMDFDTYKILVESMGFTNFKDIKSSGIKNITINNRKFKIRDDLNSIRWGEQVSYERLKEQYKDTEDYLLALGVLLTEIDSKGKEKDFDIKTFDFVVNNAADKLKLVDIYKHVTFFLNGVKKHSLKISPVFTIKKKK